MARRYEEAGNLPATAASFKSALLVYSATTVRPKIYDFTIGTEGTPADNALVWQLLRISTAQTGGAAVTPAALDPGDPASLGSAVSASTAITVEPTTGTFMWGPMGMNQRATYRWVAAPSGEIVLPATASNGAAIQVKSAGYTGQSDAVVHHEE
jgi:hypothetical protein